MSANVFGFRLSCFDFNPPPRVNSSSTAVGAATNNSLQPRRARALFRPGCRACEGIFAARYPPASASQHVSAFVLFDHVVVGHAPLSTPVSTHQLNAMLPARSVVEF